MKTILVTGATAGFGRAIALKYAQNGHKVIITGRRQQRLDELKQQIEQEYGTPVLPLCFDVRENTEVEKALQLLPPDWQNIDILVNNAGLAAGLGPIQDGQLDHWERMIDTNIKGLLYVSKVVCNMMIAQKSGHIVNISSIAGKEVYPNGNVYCATKHAVEALTKGMRLDLHAYGIKVSSVAPGMAETEFSIVRYDGDEERAKKVYENVEPLTAADIAESVYFITESSKHVYIQDIVITPAAQANATTVRRNQ
jgi:3-hydroxy acid dehydrogenase/malonic semialdehyde reductase